MASPTDRLSLGFGPVADDYDTDPDARQEFISEPLSAPRAPGTVDTGFGVPLMGLPPGDPRKEQGDFAKGLFAEMFKSFGSGLDADGNWTWSVENAQNAFSDSPVWSTIDYLTVSVPPAKWGVAAARVGLGGAGSISKGYQAGSVSFREAVNLQRTQGVPRSAVGRAFSNPITQRFDDDYLSLMHEYGADPAELRALYETTALELKMQQQATQRFREDALRAQSRITDPSQRRALTEALEAGTDIDQAAAAAGLAGKEAARFTDAYRKTHQFRNGLHDAAYETGLISEETYLRNLERYVPRQYEEYLDDAARLGTSGAGSGASARFQARTAADHPDLTRIWDPTLSTLEMAKAADLVAKQQFAQRLAGSVIAKDGPELAEHLLRSADDGTLLTTPPVVVEELRALQAAGRLGVEEDLDRVFSNAGWRKIDDLFDSARVPGYIERLPPEFRNKYLDPHAQDGIKNMFHFMEKSELSSWMDRAYKTSLGLFRAGKTAYNPSTHVRNYFGNITFHHLATGGVPQFTPRRGLQELAKKGSVYKEAVEAGVVGSSFDVEIQEAIIDAFKRAGKNRQADAIASGRATALDFLGSSTVAKLVQQGAGKAERLYRGIDEVWKLDAYATLRAKGRTVEQAQLEVAKYMPQFLGHSPAADFIRNKIPFASFTTEALRVWRNSMIEKPHLAFAWAHMTDSMGYSIGHINGYSMDEIDAMRSELPHYEQNKKMMFMPFKIEGKPQFLDMSYLIPMGNISEAEEAENLFFGALMSPTQNPIANIIAGAATGIDPFSGRKITPRMTERALGQPIQNEFGRRAVGLAEYTAATMVPPLVPPGYAANNLLELVNGETNPYTGQPLEPDYRKTLAANLFGMRLSESSVQSQLQNARHRESRINDRLSMWRQTYTRARANGNGPDMERALENIRAIREELEPGSSDKYIKQMLKRTEPGKFRGVGTRQLLDALERSKRLEGRYSPADLEALGEVKQRLIERKRLPK